MAVSFRSVKTYFSASKFYGFEDSPVTVLFEVSSVLRLRADMVLIGATENFYLALDGQVIEVHEPFKGLVVQSGYEHLFS